jgi:hypothetical protein
MPSNPTLPEEAVEEAMATAKEVAAQGLGPVNIGVAVLRKIAPAIRKQEREQWVKEKSELLAICRARSKDLEREKTHGWKPLRDRAEKAEHALVSERQRLREGLDDERLLTSVVAAHEGIGSTPEDYPPSPADVEDARQLIGRFLDTLEEDS